MINLSRYLQRIGYDGDVGVDFITLRALHRSHMLAIPYENLDVQLQRPVTIDPHAAFEKIVDRGRGGWCYEMNGVFGLALSAVGFEVTRLAADGSSTDSHLVLTVQLAGTTYVCDVGFADGPIDPYPLIEGSFSQEGFQYRIEKEPKGRWRMHNHRFGAAQGFLAGSPNETAMASRCEWLQTDADSPFVQHAILCRHVTEQGRGSVVTLIDRVLRTITPDKVASEVIANDDEYVATLKTHFNLDLPAAAALWPALCERHEKYLRESAARKAQRAAST